MAHFLIRTEKNPFNHEIVSEFNKRINNSKNPVFVMFQGKASLLLRGSEQHIFFNVRVNPFEPPLYKYFIYFVFKKMLKKKGFGVITKLCSTSEMEKLLEDYL